MRKLITLLSAIVLFTLPACGTENEVVVPGWHASITVDCEGTVTLDADPPHGELFNLVVTGVGTDVVTATGEVRWNDYPNKVNVVSSISGCEHHNTTTTEAPPSTSVTPPTTLPPTSVPPTTTSTTSSTTVPPTTSPSTLPPPTVPDTAPVTVPPSSSTVPPPTTAKPNRPFCEVNPERCDGGLPGGVETG